MHRALSILFIVRLPFVMSSPVFEKGVRTGAVDCGCRDGSMTSSARALQPSCVQSLAVFGGKGEFGVSKDHAVASLEKLCDS